MKRTRKGLLALFMCVFTILGIYGSAAAEGSTTQHSMQIDTPSQRFIELYTGFFTSPSNYTILDADGNEITDSFYSYAVSYYSSGNFDALYNCVSENDYTLAWSTESISPSVQRSAMLITHDVTGGFYKLVDMSEFFKGKRAELTYSIRCVYTINDTTQQIVRSESPVLTVESFAPGDDFHYVQTGTSTPAVEYATGRTAAIFKGKFSMQVQYQNSGVKHPYGPFYGKVVCYPTGKHTESTMW